MRIHQSVSTLHKTFLIIVYIVIYLAFKNICIDEANLYQFSVERFVCYILNQQYRKQIVLFKHFEINQ